LLSERSQAEKATHCMIPATLHLGKGKTIEMIQNETKSGFQQFRGKGGGLKRPSTGNIVEC